MVSVPSIVGTVVKVAVPAVMVKSLKVIAFKPFKYIIIKLKY